MARDNVYHVAAYLLEDTTVSPTAVAHPIYRQNDMLVPLAPGTVAVASSRGSSVSTARTRAMHRRGVRTAAGVNSRAAETRAVERGCMTSLRSGRNRAHQEPNRRQRRPRPAQHWPHVHRVPRRRRDAPTMSSHAHARPGVASPMRRERQQRRSLPTPILRRGDAVLRRATCSTPAATASQSLAKDLLMQTFDRLRGRCRASLQLLAIVACGQGQEAQEERRDQASAAKKRRAGDQEALIGNLFLDSRPRARLGELPRTAGTRTQRRPPAARRTTSELLRPGQQRSTAT